MSRTTQALNDSDQIQLDIPLLVAGKIFIKDTLYEKAIVGTVRGIHPEV
jgi:hypothetical protein